VKPLQKAVKGRVDKQKTMIKYPNAGSSRMINTTSIFAGFFLGFFFLSVGTFAQQISKIQQAVNSIKETYYCEDQDYHTDGQRTVWVKSYKKWMPEDLAVMKKETPATLRFLGMAAQKTRYDVLEQLLPDYYRTHGGAKAFANDILKERPVSSGR